MKDALTSKDGWVREKKRDGREGGKETSVYLGRGVITVADFLKLGI